ncbi:MAG: hypothetical protein ACO35Q_10055, partial [Prochlorothrix sp.]
MKTTPIAALQSAVHLKPPPSGIADLQSAVQLKPSPIAGASHVSDLTDLVGAIPPWLPWFWTEEGRH